MVVVMENGIVDHVVVNGENISVAVIEYGQRANELYASVLARKPMLEIEDVLNQPARP